MKARIFLVIVFPFVLLWAIVHRLCSEARSATRMIWLDVRLEIHDAKRVWRAGRITPKDSDA